MTRDKFKIGVGAVRIGGLEKGYVLRALSQNRLSYGPYIAKFEREFAKIHNRRFAIFGNSGTSALQVGFHALKRKYHWKDGSEVLVPALTFVASINTILQNNLTPVFVDIEPNYYEIDPEKIEEKITPKTVAIEPVHLFGQPCEMEKIVAIAKKYSLKILEDSCETMFAKYKGRVVGSWGDVSCFSTYSAHLIVTGVGGFATTNDAKLAVSMKSLFNHGRDGIYVSIDDDDIKDDRKLAMIIKKRFHFVDTGYSYRATELEAALGLGQLSRFKKMIEKRKRNAAYLTSALSPLSSFLQLPKIRKEAEHVFMVYPILIKEKKVKTEELTFYLEKQGIETRFLLPTLSQPIYRKLFGNIEDNYPVAQIVSQRGFYIGCHQELTKRQLDYIVEHFFNYFKKKKFINP